MKSKLVDRIVDMMRQELITRPERSAWVEMAYNTLPKKLIQPFIEAPTIEVVLSVLQPHASPVKLQALILQLCRSSKPIKLHRDGTLVQQRNSKEIEWYSHQLMVLKHLFEAEVK